MAVGTFLKDNEATSLITTAQTVTGSFADLGGVMNLSGLESLNLWAKLDVNDSLDVQFRFVAMLTPDATDLYVLPIETVSSSAVDLDGEEKILSDGDQNIVLSFNLGGGVLFGKIQVKAGTVGASAGSITAANVTVGRS